jgi:hypothetical protein
MIAAQRCEGDPRVWYSASPVSHPSLIFFAPAEHARELFTQFLEDLDIIPPRTCLSYKEHHQRAYSSAPGIKAGALCSSLQGSQ